jgi:hypothetical protein
VANEVQPGSGASSKTALKAVAVLALIAAVGVGGYLGGSSAADDSDHVRSLQAELRESERERDDAEGDMASSAERIDVLETENADLEQTSEKLAEQLAAELNLKGQGSSGHGRGPAPTGDLQIGAATRIGDYTVKPTSVEQRGSGRFRATITVKNDGSESNSPFCGGGAQLIDKEGRSFDGDAVISESSDACEDLQPGLSYTVMIDFKTAPDAKAAVLELSPDVFDEETYESWTI